MEDPIPCAIQADVVAVLSPRGPTITTILRNVYLEIKIGVIKGVRVVAVERLATRPVVEFIFSSVNSSIQATTPDLGASFAYPYSPSLTLHRP